MERTLIINQQSIKLIITKQVGICTKCYQKKEIRLIGQKNNRVKEYCETCSLNALYRLEQSNYQFTDKERIIKELRAELNNISPKLWTDYYSVKKPYCFNCVQSGIKETEYNFCGSDCLVQSWIKYHGHYYQ